jgi:hypothetical protein
VIKTVPMKVSDQILKRFRELEVLVAQIPIKRDGAFRAVANGEAFQGLLARCTLSLQSSEMILLTIKICRSRMQHIGVTKMNF